MVEKLEKLTDSMMEFKEVMTKEMDGVKEEIKKINERVDEIEVKMQKPAKPVEQKRSVKEAFYNFIRTGKVPDEIKALVEDSATATVLVPQEIYSEIMTELPKRTVVRKITTSIPVKGNAIDVRSFGEVSVSWAKLETGGTLTESTPSVGVSKIEVHDLVGLVKLGRDLIQDTDVALERLIIDGFTQKVAEAEDQAFLVGDGTDKPLGIMNASITEVTSAAANAIDVDDLLEVYFALPEQYRQNAVWVMNSAVEKYLRKLKDANGQYILQNDLGSSFGRTLFGRPVVNSDYLPAAVSGGNSVILFGDFKNGFLILDKQNGMSIQRLEELYAPNGQIGIMLYYRVGGGVIRTNAFAKLTVASA